MKDCPTRGCGGKLDADGFCFVCGKTSLRVKKICKRGHVHSASRCPECRRQHNRRYRKDWSVRKQPDLPADNQGVIPTELVRPIVERGIVEHGSQGIVAQLTRVPERRLYEIRHGKTRRCSIDLVDRLLVGLNLLELWYLPAPDGFAEWYVTDEPEPEPASVRPLRLSTLYHKGVRTPETRAAVAELKRNRYRRLRGLPAPEPEPRTCVRCGVNTDERTFGCRACLSRHSFRRLSGLPSVDRPAGCGRCGVGLDELTDGCVACRRRHWKRAQRESAA